MFSRGVEASAEQTSSQNKFVTSTELEAAVRYYERAAARLEAAEKLNSGLDAIAKEGFDAAFKKYPYLNEAGEAGDTQEKRVKCLRDIKHYLRLIQYCLIVGGTGPLDE